MSFDDEKLDKEELPPPATLDLSIRLFKLEERANRLEKELETMSYMLIGVILFTFLLLRRVAFEDEVPNLP
jgi:hypothetical protein